MAILLGRNFGFLADLAVIDIFTNSCFHIGSIDNRVDSVILVVLAGMVKICMISCNNERKEGLVNNNFPFLTNDISDVAMNDGINVWVG
jgi:hypothetical protein